MAELSTFESDVEAAFDYADRDGVTTHVAVTPRSIETDHARDAIPDAFLATGKANEFEGERGNPADQDGFRGTRPRTVKRRPFDTIDARPRSGVEPVPVVLLA